MRRSFSRAALVLVWVSFTSFAQDRDLEVKVKGSSVVVRDKSKPVRHALEAQYEKIAEAQKNKDIDAMRALRTPDC